MRDGAVTTASRVVACPHVPGAVPIAEANVPNGNFNTDNAQVKFNRNNTATPNGNNGFRSVVRALVAPDTAKPPCGHAF